MIVITGAGLLSAIGTNQAETLQSLRDARAGLHPVRFLPTVHRELPVGEVPLSDDELRRLAQSPRSPFAHRADGHDCVARSPHAGTNSPRNSSPTRRWCPAPPWARWIAPSASLLARGGWSNSATAPRPPGKWPTTSARFAFVTTCSTACSSAANAFILGANLIRSGRFDRVVVGGSECLSRFHFNGFRALMILDSQPCRPFSHDRAGLNLGEGAAFVVLERESAARARGVRPLAVLEGWGNACDAYHQTATSENGEGPYLAMTQALRRAGVAPP